MDLYRNIINKIYIRLGILNLKCCVIIEGSNKIKIFNIILNSKNI